MEIHIVKNVQPIALDASIIIRFPRVVEKTSNGEIIKPAPWDATTEIAKAARRSMQSVAQEINSKHANPINGVISKPVMEAARMINVNPIATMTGYAPSSILREMNIPSELNAIIIKNAKIINTVHRKAQHSVSETFSRSVKVMLGLIP